MRTSSIIVVAVLASWLVQQQSPAPAQEKPPAKKLTPEAEKVEKFIDFLLTQFDANKDGKLSKDESKGGKFIGDNFAALDKDMNGFLERAELRPFAEKAIAFKKGPGPLGPGPFGDGAPDFDSLDKNADGRLTREELKGNALLARFADLDRDNSGQIDRDEFEAFYRKEAPKKEPKKDKAK